jgi:hypothetical protein
MITRINDFIECAYTNALDHGFHDDKCMKEAISKTLEFIKE